MLKSNQIEGALLFSKGNDFFSNGDNIQAIVYTSKAIDLLPNYADILENCYWTRAEAYMALNNFHQGITDLNIALNINNQYWLAYVSRANCYFNLRIWQSAITDYEKSLEAPIDIWHQIAPQEYLEETFFEIYYNLGRAYNEISDFKKSVKYFEKSYGLRKIETIKSYIDQLNFRIQFLGL